MLLLVGIFVSVEAWPGRKSISLRGVPVAFLGREALLRNKRAAARPKDLLDVELLERQRG